VVKDLRVQNSGFPLSAKWPPWRLWNCVHCAVVKLQIWFPLKISSNYGLIVQFEEGTPNCTPPALYVSPICRIRVSSFSSFV
jgi:hypothetical protein